MFSRTQGPGRELAEDNHHQGPVEVPGLPPLVPGGATYLSSQKPLEWSDPQYPSSLFSHATARVLFLNCKSSRPRPQFTNLNGFSPSQLL